MKRLLTLAALLCIGVPTALAVPPDGSVSAACKAQRNTMGMTAFRQLYAPAGTPKAAMDACVAQQAQLVSTETKNAAKACKAERGTTAASRAAFAETYGTNANDKNAFGKCVSQHAATEVAEQQQAILNAAKACKAERGTTPASRAAFATSTARTRTRRTRSASASRRRRKPRRTDPCATAGREGLEEAQAPPSFAGRRGPRRAASGHNVRPAGCRSGRTGWS